VVTINIAFYAYLLYLGVVFAFGAIRKEKQVLWVALSASAVLSPARGLFPTIRGSVPLVFIFFARREEFSCCA
jgi:hypothetical protein